MMTETKKTERCERCRAEVDKATAYRQIEQSRWGRVQAWYCDTCRRTLAGCGAGERSDLAIRAIARPAYEQEYKGE